jgi:hypothetical protein
MTEIWKEVPGYEMYSISNKGNVFSRYHERELKHVLRKGYHGITLWKGGKYKHFRIHALMVRVFEDNWDYSLVAAHMDGNKDNNNLQNIKLITQQENIMHKKEHGTLLIREKHPMAKLTEKDVKKIKELLKQKTLKWDSPSNKKIAKLFNVSESTIGAIDNGIIWREE